uniref:non-specific serine/threonine protein kinase n=1 Tax=Salix viminalis TaxID=40686 RepID=A0A6N2LJ45_SALVM
MFFQIPTNNCAPSSCGNITHISYPFRLQTDPISCGRKEYELGCENNRTTLYFQRVKYYVQAIDYDREFTIRLVDADFQKDDCLSIPRHSSYPFDYSHYYPFRYASSSFSLTFISCPNPIPSPPFNFINISSCKNGSIYSPSFRHMEGYSYVMAGYRYWMVDHYVMVGEIAEVPDLCRIDLIYEPPLLSQLENITNLSLIDVHDITNMSLIEVHDILANMSLIEVHDILAYGFELSWSEAFCDYAKVNNLTHCSPRNKLHTKTINSDFLSILIVLLITLLVLLVSIEFLQSDDHNLIPIRYSYSEIKKITNKFSDKLGEGGYGSVYKGKLRSGRFAAVKLLRQEKTNGQDFINEVATIGRIHHCNVVQLIGFTAEGSKRALVYEFMPNGSLEKYIFSRQGSIPLSNHKLYEISLGVARGIEYLHQGCEMQILHFDIKPHNILLDENFTPKVSDFGLAKLYPANNNTVPLTMARGTMGYMAPELFYKSIGGVSYKADVYSFGMLLMEMVGRRKNLNALADHSSQMYFPSWIYDQVSEGKDI